MQTQRHRTSHRPAGPFALLRALDHARLDYGDWAAASGLVDEPGEADEHLDHTAEAVEIAATRTGMAELTHWRHGDVEAVITAQRGEPRWCAAAVLCALHDFLRYLEETDQWSGSDAEWRSRSAELRTAIRALPAGDEAGVRRPA